MEEEIGVRETCTLGGGDPCDGAGGRGAGAGWGLVIPGGTSGGNIYWKNSMNNHVILKGVDVEVMKVIQLASEVHN